MKKRTESAVLFVLGFVVAYLILCYAVPGMRIRLAAGPWEYFWESIRHMVLLKTGISLLAGALFSIIPGVRKMK